MPRRRCPRPRSANSGTLVAVRSNGTVLAAPFDVRRHGLHPLADAGHHQRPGRDRGHPRLRPIARRDWSSTIQRLCRCPPWRRSTARGTARVLDPGRGFSLRPRRPVRPTKGGCSIEHARGCRLDPARYKRLDAGPLARLSDVHHRHHQTAAWAPPTAAAELGSDLKDDTHLYRVRANGGTTRPRHLFSADSAQIERGELVERTGGRLAYPHRHGAGPPRRLSPPGRRRRPADPRSPPAFGRGTSGMSPDGPLGGGTCRSECGGREEVVRSTRCSTSTAPLGPGSSAGGAPAPCAAH